MGTFTDLAIWIDGTNVYVRYAYDGDTGLIYNLKFRIYQKDYKNVESRPRSFYKQSNPAKSSTVVVPLSKIVDEETGSAFDLIPGQSWVHAWWDSFNVTYGRADALIGGVEPPKGRFISTSYVKDYGGKVWLIYKAEATVTSPRIYIEQYNPSDGYRSWSFTALQHRFEGESYPGLVTGHQSWFRLSDDSTGQVLDEQHAYLTIEPPPPPPNGNGDGEFLGLPWWTLPAVGAASVVILVAGIVAYQEQQRMMMLAMM